MLVRAVIRCVDARVSCLTPALLWLEQVEHHLFPRIPRHNLRAIRKPIRDLCEKHGIKFSIVGLVEANKMLIRSFLDVAAVARQMDVEKVRSRVAVLPYWSRDLFRLL